MQQSATSSSHRRVLPEDALPDQCDLVMKGGITSGIVYPRAIVEFARRFRLRSIGGASAGAIAAAAAAAAQFGKNQGQDRFAELDAVPAWLAGTGSGRRTRMLSLFQPQPALRALYAWLLDGLSDTRYSRGRTVLCWTLASVRRFPLQALAGVAIVGVLVVLCRWLTGNPWLPGFSWVLLGYVPLLILGSTLGGLAGVAYSVLRKLPRNDFGICTGLQHGSADALTPWLHGLIQRLAGREAGQAPLTFGDLWGNGYAPGTAHPGQSTSSQRDIDLRVMTTALSQGRPYSLPFEPGEAFHFDEAQFRRLFPGEIVDWLLRHPARIRDKRMRLPGRHPLPAMADLPIVVAARMSLSFPLLITAVPLLRCHRHSKQEETVWFSDGGICSNFPVHYFDAPLPSRPTFAINLTDDRFLPRGRELIEPEDFVHLATGNRQGQDHHVVDLRKGDRYSLPSLLGAIVETLHNWSDNTQLRVPGFRDRVAHVRLRHDEGGMNLRMSSELILRVAERGRHAAQRLIDGFLPREQYTHATTWQNHRWVRFRTSFTLIEEALLGVLASHRRFQGKETSVEFLHDFPPSYVYGSNDRAQRSKEAYQRIVALAEELEAMRESTPDGRGDPIFNPAKARAPRPRSQLRIRPRM